ncbi:substrate-binding domain-containing protein [Saccharopolyspora sp. K220]|nr:substrate-binding domain-containing protein [Saccharopolyspora soli]
MAWEDSWISELVRPRLTALQAPIEESARTAVRMIEQLVRGEAVASVVLPGRRLVVRDSTGPAARSSNRFPVTRTTVPNPPRFGVNYTPSEDWMFQWMNLDADVARADFEAIAGLGVDHVRVFPLWPVLQPNRTLIRAKR